MSLLHSRKLWQLQIVWRGSIVPEQPLSLAAHFHSAFITFLSQWFAGKHRKNPNPNNKNPQIKAMTSGTATARLYLQSFHLPPKAVSHLGLAPELIQTLGIPKCFLQTAVIPDPYPSKTGHWHPESYYR